ncbi:retrovirus-related pol polyprotein from transposon TNT 1-94 [Tanacetum coccineum]
MGSRCTTMNESESKKESWGDSEDEDDNDDDDDGDNDDDGDSDDHEDDSDDERTESDKDEIPDPKLTNVDQTKHEEEEYDDEFYEEEDEENIDDEETMYDVKHVEVTKELYEDVNVNLGNVDTEMTNWEKNKSYDKADYKKKLYDALTVEEKKTRKIDRLARSLLIQGLPNNSYSLIDNNDTAKDLWDALERQMRGSEYGEQDRKAAILYEYETFRSTEGEQLLDTYLRYLQVINDLKKCGYKKDNCELNYKFLNNLQPEWKQYGTLMRQTKNLMDINIDALYNFMKQNQGDVNDVMGYKKKPVVVTSYPLALVAEKTKVSKRREKVVVQSESEGSDDEDIRDLKKIIALTSSASSSANKKPEYVKSEEKKEDKKADEKKWDMSKVKCYNFKKGGHFAKDYKKAKVKDYNYYKTKMLLAKKDGDEQVLLVEDQAWMESSKESSSSDDETIAEVSYYSSDSESESEYETSEYYDNSTNYGLFFDNDDDPEIFHDAIESSSENFNENDIVSQKDLDKSEVDHNDSEEKDHLVDKLIKKFNQKIAKCQKRIEKANQQSKDLENQNKDLQDKYDVLKNQLNIFEKKNNEFNEQIKVLNKKNDDLLAQAEVLKEQLKVKHVVIDTHTKYLDTLSSVRRPKHSDVIWKKKGSSNTSNVDLSSVNTRSAYACNDAMNVSCNSRLYASYDVNDLFVFDDVSIRNSQVSKMPFRKKPRDSLNVRSKSNSNNSLPRTLFRWLSKMQLLAEPVAKWIPKDKHCPDLSLDNRFGMFKAYDGNRALLMNFVEKFLRTVCFGNNDFAVIAGYGDIVIGSMTIKKVYCVEVQHVRTDNGTEFKNKTLAKFFDEVRITQQFYIARTPQQNGVVKRRNRTLVKAARTMLTFANLPLFLWAEDIATTCFTQNRSIIQKHFDKTPYELINKRKPNIKLFHVFGCRCYLFNDYDDVGKLKAKGDIGVFVVYSKESAAFRVYNKRSRKIHESVNVNFDEFSEMASKQFSLEPGLSNLNKTGKSSNPTVSQVSESSKKDLEDLFHNFYDEYFDASKITKSPTTNVETSNDEIPSHEEEVFHESFESFQEGSSSSSLNDDVQQSSEEVMVPLTNTQSISSESVPNVNEASTSHNVFN